MERALAAKLLTMQIKISVDIHAQGDNNAAILAMVAANNSGKLLMDISDIKGFLKWKKVEYPAMNKDLSWKKDSGQSNLYIFEDSSSVPTLILTWKEVHELVPAADANDLKDINI